MTTHVFHKQLVTLLAGIMIAAVVLVMTMPAQACPPINTQPPPCDKVIYPCCTGGGGGAGNGSDNDSGNGSGGSGCDTGNGCASRYDSGSQLVTAGDVGIPGGALAYDPQRRYDSQISTQALGQGSYGNKWGSYQIDTRLIAEGGDIITVIDPIETRIFTWTRLSLLAPPGYNAELRPIAPNQYELIRNDTKQVLRFYPINSSPTSGKLQYREDAYGNRITFNYNANGRLVLVTTPESHQVIYKWNVNSTPERIRSAEVRAGGEIVSAATYVYHGPVASDGGTLDDLAMVHRLTWVRHSGTTTGAGTTTRLNDTALMDKNAAVGDRVVIADGTNVGHIREITSVGSNYVEWTDPLPYSVEASVSYFLVKNTGKISTVYYRYYKSGDIDGTTSQLKAVYENGAVQAIISKAGWTSAGDLLSKADNTLVDGRPLKSYAAQTFTYYKANLPTSNITAGGGWSQNGTFWGGSSDSNLESLYGGTNCNEAGFVRSAMVRDSCSSCGGPTEGVTYYFYYMDKNSGANVSETHRITVEDMMYGSQRVQRKVVALNQDGSLLREAVIDNPVNPRYWCASYIRDNNTTSKNYDRPLQFRMPSAHTVVNSAATLRNFLDPTAGSNDANTVNASSGLVYLYGYNIDGHLTSTRVKNGAGDNVPAYYISATEYGSDDVAGESSNFPKVTYTYPTQQLVMTNGKATTYFYTFYDVAKRAVQQTTETGPVIVDTENGDNTGIVTMTYHDAKGRLRWFRDGEDRISYYSYHTPTGGLAYMARDVKTDSNAGGLPAEIANGSPGLWDAWGSTTAPTGFQQTGDALGLVTKAEFDGLGREVKLTDSMGTIAYHVYRDNTNEVRTYPAWDTTTSKPRLPVEVTQKDAGDRIALQYAFDASAITFPNRPNGSETVPASLYTSRTTWNYDVMGRLASVDNYVDANPANKLTTQYGYDDRGRQSTITAPDGTVMEIRYDSRNRLNEIWTGSGSQIVKIANAEYDNNGVGDGYITAVKIWLDDSAIYATTTMRYDYRGRRDRTLGPDNVLAVTEYNWANIPTSVIQYASVMDINASPTTVIAKSTTDYDAVGRAFRQMQYKVASGSATADKLTTYFWHNKNGQQIKSRDPNGLFLKTQYDGVGRYITLYVSYQDDEPVATVGTYAAATNVIGDVVIEQSKIIYDSANNVILTKTFQRKDDTPVSRVGELVLTSGPTDPTATAQIVANWYEDGTYRLRKTANYGDNGNTDMISRPGTEPNPGTMDALVITYEYAYFSYDANNQAWPVTKITGNDGKTNWTINDILGRTYKTIENYGDGQVGNSDNDVDRTTLYGYDAKGRMTTITAMNPKGTHVEDQVTTYVYDPQAFLTSPANYRQDMVWAIIYPDSTATYNPTAAAGSRIPGSDYVRFTYDRLNRRISTKDQRGVEHTYVFDPTDRLKADKITTWDNSGGVDQTIRAITYAYDVFGRLAKITSHGNATENPADTTNVRNQIVYAYDDGVGNLGWGNVKTSWQSHTDSAITSGVGESPKVSYTFIDGTAANQARFVRLSNVTYPNGRNVFYNKSNELNDPAEIFYDRAGLLRSIASAATPTSSTLADGAKYAEYTYRGISAVASARRPKVTGGLTLLLRNSLDRFGRIVDQKWSNDAGTVRDRFRYGYNAAGSRIWREVMDNQAFGGVYFSEYYTYDGLNRLTNMKRGQLTGTPYTGIAGTAMRQETFGLEALGNWRSFDVLLNGSATLNQTREHNAANEISTISQATGQSQWIEPAYDAAGNMITGVAGTNHMYRYDAWNRLVHVDDVATYQYDGLHRRIAKLLPDGANWNRTDYYYNENWQVLEERTGTVANQTTPATAPYVQWIWDAARYIDAPVCRLRDTAGDGTWTEALYYTIDANMNVTALVDAAGNVVERTTYDAYGKPTFYAGSSFATANSTSSVANEILFTGYRYDAHSGTYHVRNREYDPILGRWIQPDPERYIDGMNYYQYAKSNPLRYRDPSGLVCDDECQNGQIQKKEIMGWRFKGAYRKGSPGAEIAAEAAYNQLDTISMFSSLANGGLALSKFGISVAEGVVAITEEIVGHVVDYGLTPDTDAAVEMLKGLGDIIRKSEGTIIWIQVAYEICEPTRCCLIFKPLRWNKKERWHRCSIGDSDIFGLETEQQVLRALGPCMKEAMEETK